MSVVHSLNHNKHASATHTGCSHPLTADLHIKVSTLLLIKWAKTYQELVRNLQVKKKYKHTVFSCTAFSRV